MQTYAALLAMATSSLTSDAAVDLPDAGADCTAAAGVSETLRRRRRRSVDVGGGDAGVCLLALRLPRLLGVAGVDDAALSALCPLLLLLMPLLTFLPENKRLYYRYTVPTVNTNRPLVT